MNLVYFGFGFKDKIGYIIIGRRLVILVVDLAIDLRNNLAEPLIGIPDILEVLRRLPVALALIMQALLIDAVLVALLVKFVLKSSPARFGLVESELQLFYILVGAVKSNALFLVNYASVIQCSRKLGNIPVEALYLLPVYLLSLVEVS